MTDEVEGKSSLWIAVEKSEGAGFKKGRGAEMFHVEHS
jgi:hypothetical protein